ncbi:MAG: hypothetical protein K9J25_05205 [Bacteroidales bacterium]|nr:hypothetical protein [Bacteroidales bacterium]
MKKELSLMFLVIVLVGACKPKNLAITGQKTFFVSWEAGSLEFEIESNTDWLITSTADWLSYSPESGNGNAIISVEYSENADYTSRNSALSVNGTGVDGTEFFSVTQQAHPSFTADISWTEKAEMPAEICFLPPSASVVNNEILIIGGANPDEPLNTVYAYDPQANSWSTRASMIDARWGHAANVVNGKIYVMGGCLTSTGDATSKTEVYDPALDEWQSLSNMPTPRIGAGSCVVDGKIYIMGGRSADPGGDYNNSMEVYDPLTNRWASLSPVPVAMGYHSSSVVNNTIYAISGTDVENNGQVETHVYKYNIETDIWSGSVPLKQGRWSLSTCTVDSLIICMGGYTSTTELANLVEVITNNGEMVIGGTNMLYKRAAFSSCYYNGKIYVFGGTASSPPIYGARNNVEEGVVVITEE